MAVAAVAFALCYADTIGSLIKVWSGNPLYSYGFAVPLIAAYIFWTRFEQAPPPVVVPNYRLGVPVIVAGLAILVLGRLCAMTSFEGVSLVMTLLGLLLALFGRDAVRPHWFALAYLLLMLPIWSIPIAALQDPSRILSAKIALGLLHLIGTPALRVDTNIFLASHSIAVLKECSGVNQLIALTAMVLPAGYLWLNSNVRRVILLGFAVVVSYVGNGIRIAAVCWMANKGYADAALDGTSHLMQGLVVSAVGYLVIGACLSLLARTTRRRAEDAPVAEVTAPVAIPAVVGRRLWLDVAIVGIMLAATATRLSATPLDVPIIGGLRSLETHIGDWTQEIGLRTSADRLPAIDDALVDVGGYSTVTGERRFDGVDTDVVRVYRNRTGGRVQLYVGYYERQLTGKELAGDASDALAAAAVPLTVDTGAEPVVVGEIQREKSDRHRGLLYWYDVNGRIAPDKYRAKVYTIIDGVTRRRSNAAVVMIAWEAAPGRDATLARQQAIEFARTLLPTLRRHLPS